MTDFNAAGGRAFGSGWVFVAVIPDGRLAIEAWPNQDSPLIGQQVRSCLAMTSGNTPITLSTRTATPITRRHGGA
jgi:superoxide dismutase